MRIKYFSSYPGIVTSNGHNLKEGQQIRFISPSFAVNSIATQ